MSDDQRYLWRRCGWIVNDCGRLEYTIELVDEFEMEARAAKAFETGFGASPQPGQDND